MALKLIVGLGNPGEKFIHTRHNLGFEVVELLRHKLEAGKWSLEGKFKSEIIKNNYTLDANRSTLILARPITFMNRSGMAVSKLASYFKVIPEDIIIIHDDLDLLSGHLKIRLGGGAAGHHGVESIISELGTDKFIRVRLGIGTSQGFLGEHKKAAFNAEQFVLSHFTAHEKSKVKSMIKRAVKAIETILKEGIDSAQNQFN